MSTPDDHVVHVDGRRIHDLSVVCHQTNWHLTHDPQHNVVSLGNLGVGLLGKRMGGGGGRLGLLAFNASATARVISRRWNDDDAETSYLVEETGVPGGNHRPTAVGGGGVMSMMGNGFYLYPCIGNTPRPSDIWMERPTYCGDDHVIYSGNEIRSCYMKRLSSVWCHLDVCIPNRMFWWRDDLTSLPPSGPSTDLCHFPDHTSPNSQRKADILVI